MAEKKRRESPNGQKKGFIYRRRKGYEFIKFGIRFQWKIGK